MSDWRVSLFGDSTLKQISTNRMANQRYRQCTQLLAALILQESGPDIANTSLTVSRQWLAELIWADAMHPRAALRQGLHNLKHSLGEDCIFANRDIITLQSSRICIDALTINQIIRSLDKLPTSAGPAEVVTVGLALLEISGKELLASHPQVSPDFDSWLHACRSHAYRRICSSISRVQSALIQIKNYEAAYDAGRSILIYGGPSEKVSAMQWQLMKRLGIPKMEHKVTRDIANENSAVTPLNRDHHHSEKPTTQRFEAAFMERFQPLSTDDQEMLCCLSLLPPFFTETAATAITLITTQQLSRFTRGMFIEQRNDGWAMLDTVRLLLQALLTPSISSRVKRRMISLSTAWLKWQNGVLDHSKLDINFQSLKEAGPYITRAIAYIRSYPADIECIELMSYAHLCGFDQAIKQNFAWMDKEASAAAENEEISTYLRINKARVIAGSGNYHVAAEIATETLQSLKPGSELWLYVAEYAAEFTHRAEEYRQSLALSNDVIAYLRKTGRIQVTAGWLRFQSEIYLALNDLTNAESCLTQCLAIIDHEPGQALVLANCHYWLGHIAMQLSSFSDAQQHILKSIELRSLHNDLKGEAQSLAMLAEVYSRNGRHTEAISTARSSLRLMDTLNDPNSRAAILGTMAKIYNRFGLKDDARSFGTEALSHWTAVGHNNWMKEATAILESIETTHGR